MSRRIVSMIVVVVLLIVNVVPAFAAEATTTDEKAAVLNKLNILKGGSKDYELDSQMTRAMAATFMVRMLGMEEEVLENKTKYNKTEFSDVPRNEWYAPYVGYCTQQNIIGGYDGKYSPDAYISEKAFLKLVLGVLGYIQNKDFTWDEVYRKAYDLGIVTARRYYSRTNDEYKYLREAAVGALYNALTIPKKDSELTVIDDLIEKGAITEDLAIELGYREKIDIPTEILSVEVQNSSTILISLNEEIIKPELADIVIFDKNSPNAKLNVISAELAGTQLTVKTYYQDENREYELKINNVRDLEENTIESISANFVGYSVPAIQSDLFKISKVVPLSNKTIQIYFTQPLSLTAEYFIKYEIYHNDTLLSKGDRNTATIKYQYSEPNSICITLLNQNFFEGEQYSVKINGEFMSVYSVRLNNGSGDSMSFTGRSAADSLIAITSYSIKNINTIELVFNKEVDLSTASTLSNYVLKTSSGAPVSVIKALLTGENEMNGKTVRLRTGTNLAVNEIYDLTVENIKDSSLATTIPKASYYMTTASFQGTEMSILYAEAANNREIAIYLNRRMNTDSVSATNKYLITCSGYSAVPDKVYYDPKVNPYMIKLYLPSDKLLASNNAYTVTVLDGAADELLNTAGQNLTYSISGNDSTVWKIVAQEAKYIGDSRIKVTFSGEIANQSPNTTTSNYVLEYGEGTGKVTVVCDGINYVDAKTLVLRFSSMQIGLQYTLKFNALTNYAGNAAVFSTDTNTAGVVWGQ
ncbi:MAG: S-layer homology domain-containing protein [Bacillota bacterium]